MLVNEIDDFDGDGIADVLDDDDNDGIPDWCELEYGWDPFDPNDPAEDDPDGDGLTNAEECELGTNPLVNDDFLFSDGFEEDDET